MELVGTGSGAGALKPTEPKLEAAFVIYVSVAFAKILRL